MFAKTVLDHELHVSTFTDVARSLSSQNPEELRPTLRKTLAQCLGGRDKPMGLPRSAPPFCAINCTNPISQGMAGLELRKFAK